MLLTLSFALTIILWNSSFAQDCNNPLLQVFNFTKLTAPQAGSSYPYCTNLQNGLSCCSNTTVAGFQTKVNNLIANIQSIAGKRDTYMDELNTEFTNQYQTANIKLQQFSSQVADIVRSHPQVGYPLQSQLYLFQIYSSELRRIDGVFTSALRSYQRARVTCFSALVEIQAAMWCLACDATYAAQGVHPDGSLNVSSTVCETIQNSCLSFATQGDVFNALYQAEQSYQRVRGLTKYLLAYETNGGYLPDYTVENDIYKPQETTEQTVVTPGGCNSNNCTWLCDNLFSAEFIMNQTLVAHGAGIIGANDVLLQAIGLNAMGSMSVLSVEEEEDENEEENSPSNNEEMTLQTEEFSPRMNGTNVTNDGKSGIVIDGGNVDNILIAAIQSTNEAIALLTNQTDGLAQSSQSSLILVVTSGYWTPSITTSRLSINVVPDPSGVSGLGTSSGSTSGIVVDDTGSQNEEVVVNDDDETVEDEEAINNPGWQ